MILKNLAAMCRKRLFIEMFHDGNGMQWIGEGHAVYPMVGIPEVNKEQVMFLFDIPEKNRAKCMVTDLGYTVDEFYDVSDGAADNEVQIMPPAMMTGGNLLTPIMTSQGIAFFNAEYLKPVSDCEDLSLYERYTKSGDLYLVAKSGMMVEAVVLPEDMSGDHGKNLLESLKQITKMMAAQLGEEDEP